MNRSLGVAISLLLLSAFVTAQPNRADGADEILAVVNGKAITYTQIVGDVDMQAEINAIRTIQRVDPSVSDDEIEKDLVFQRLRSFVLQTLLDAEADRIQLKITDAQMRQIIARERKLIGLEDSDVKGWATYLKEKFNLSPTEYKARRSEEIRRGEIMNYMAGYYGPLPPQFPLEIYFSLSVTPREVRQEFERTADQWRVARNIDYQQFKLLYPSDVSLDARRKLVDAVWQGENSVRSRVQANESLEKASDGLKQLIEDLGIPGVRMEVTERKTAKDDSELDATAYQMVLSVAATGGVSEIGRADETDENGQQYEGVTFVQLFSRDDGDKRNYESPKVQEGIRNKIQNQRLARNRAKVEQALMKRAAIVPEKLFVR
ncbi:MAG: SurA N-terminal domain-containing protein [Planctomycetes bacterium]|nr:SurA N-terminal domain-containing protein [Planctomycetota bacterium]MCA8937315.1 SurA N-terminal domain-containing protein [Planctomycetota bacterium]MCA8946057.1 SurA N-terminal domain-containing protein [Planctomycetota bacterium]